MADSPSYPGAPRWVKVIGIISVVLVLLFLVLKLTGIAGDHGPGRHLPLGDVGGPTTSSDIAQDQAPPRGPGGRTAPDGGHR